MSNVDLSLSVGKVYAEYGVNSKIDVNINDVEVDDIIGEVGYHVMLEHIDNDKIKEYLEDEGFTVEED